MTDFDDLIGSETVSFGVPVSDKKQLFELIARMAAEHAGVPAPEAEAQLFDREKLGSTGFGDGVAIPHGRLDGIDRPFGLFLRLAEPVDYDSVDDVPVDCVFALFSPKDDGATHLRALARVSRQFRDSDFVAKLRGARSADALYALMTDLEAADAA
ncbi:MAG: PTS transporter subunit EIIA [Sphingomonadaceae bacterium]|nr:PTS transporter subunit EIIA [Sphingomonadaceae bacterium]